MKDSPWVEISRTEVDSWILNETPIEKNMLSQKPSNINHRVWLKKSSKHLHQQRDWALNSYLMKPCNFMKLRNFWLKDTPKNQHQSSLFPSSFPFQFPRRRGVFRPRLELSKAAGLMKQLKSLKRSRGLADVMPSLSYFSWRFTKKTVPKTNSKSPMEIGL